MSEHFDGKKSVQLLDLPPMLINNRKKYLQLKNNLIKFDSNREHVFGLAGVFLFFTCHTHILFLN